MELFIVITCWLLFGGVTSYFAAQRGRDPFAWFMIGLLLGILGLLLLFLLPPVSESEVPDQKDSQEIEISPVRLQDWFYLTPDRVQIGPVSFDVLQAAWKESKIGPDSFVWSHGMEDWKKIAELSSLREALQ